MNTPYDSRLPSPIARLQELRSSSTESVVRRGGLSDVQALMARPGALEDNLWDLCGSPTRPDLVLLTGSAGSGKTATIGHLRSRDAAQPTPRFGAVIADATHAESPNEDQVNRLTAFFAPFADGAQRPGGPCRLIAMNTGMAMKFFSDLRTQQGTHNLRSLEQHLRQRLGLPGHVELPNEPLTWLEEAVLVVNLDLRPTAGNPGGILDRILAALDPKDPDGVLEGTPRCDTCTVQEWCWPMANAATLSHDPGRQVIDAAAGTAAVRRGRELPPRDLWDAAANLALSGLEAPPGQDPCQAVVTCAASKDAPLLLRSLASHAAFEQAQPNTLLDELAQTDPTYTPDAHTHDRLSTVGLSPSDEALNLVTWLTGHNTTPHPAIQNASAIVARNEHVLEARAYARAGWLGGDITPSPQADPVFDAALNAQSIGAQPGDVGEGAALLRALEDIAAGLEAGFGTTAGVETFYPTEGPGQRDTDLLVKADLIDDQLLWTSPQGDPATSRNPQGAHLVGYRQLALAIRIGDVDVEVDYPLWQLLDLARAGTAPSTVDLDRYIALRRAMETIGRIKIREPKLPLLVIQRTSGRKFRVARYGTTTSLRASEVE